MLRHGSMLEEYQLVELKYMCIYTYVCAHVCMQIYVCKSLSGYILKCNKHMITYHGARFISI